MAGPVLDASEQQQPGQMAGTAGCKMEHNEHGVADSVRPPSS